MVVGLATYHVYVPIMTPHAWCNKACRHSVSIWAGHAPHLSVAHVQLVFQGRVLRVAFASEGGARKLPV